MKFFASFDTLLDPRSAKVVEIEITSKIALFAMILRSNIPVCTAGTLVVKNAYPGAVRVAAAVGELTSSTATSCFDMGIMKNWLRKSRTMEIIS